MKKSIIVLLILVLVAGFAFAADVAFSGELRAGYKFLAGANENWSTSGIWGDGNELKLTMKLKGDFWTINVKSLGKMDSKGALDANIEMDIDKLIDMGDFKLALNAGNNSNVTALSAFNDVTGDEYYKMKLNGKTTGQVKMAYKNAKFQIYFDPTKGYNNYGEYGVALQNDFADGAVSAAVAYINGAKFRTYSANEVNPGKKYDITLKDALAKHGIGLSAKIDIAKLAGFDGKLIFSVYDNMAPKAEQSVEVVDDKVTYAFNTYSEFANSLAINLQAGKGKLSGWGEFRLDTTTNNTWNYTEDKVKKEGGALANTVTPGFILNAKYAFTDKWSLGVTGGIENCKNVANSWKVYGNLAYSIFNFEFGCNKNSSEYFYLKPYFKVAF